MLAEIDYRVEDNGGLKGAGPGLYWGSTKGVHTESGTLLYSAVNFKREPINDEIHRIDFRYLPFGFDAIAGASEQANAIGLHGANLLRQASRRGWMVNKIFRVDFEDAYIVKGYNGGDIPNRSFAATNVYAPDFDIEQGLDYLRRAGWDVVTWLYDFDKEETKFAPGARAWRNGRRPIRKKIDIQYMRNQLKSMKNRLGDGCFKNFRGATHGGVACYSDNYFDFRYQF